MYVKRIFIGTEEVHYLKSDLISKINFVQTKEKKIQSNATPTGKQVFVGSVVVSNSVSKEFGVKATRSSSTLLAKVLAKTDVVRKTVSKREKMVEST